MLTWTIYRRVRCMISDTNVCVEGCLWNSSLAMMLAMMLGQKIFRNYSESFVLGMLILRPFFSAVVVRHVSWPVYLYNDEKLNGCLQNPGLRACLRKSTGSLVFLVHISHDPVYPNYEK